MVALTHQGNLQTPQQGPVDLGLGGGAHLTITDPALIMAYWKEKSLATVFLVKGLVYWEKAFLNSQNICISNHTPMASFLLFTKFL